MHLRAVNRDDHQEWLRLRLCLWPDCGAETQDAEMADILEAGADQAVFVAARPSGLLGGFVEASIHPHAIGCDTRPVGYVEGWFVDPDLRGTGVGRDLLAAAESWARNLGCREMASDTLFENEVGLRAHLACGYEETDRLIHFKKPI